MISRRHFIQKIVLVSGCAVAGNINFYVCNGAVIAPEFGDSKADRNAYNKLQQLFPDHDMVQINIDAIAAGGGGIHCTTQLEPAA